MAIPAKKQPYIVTVQPGELLSIEEYAALPPEPEGWRSELIEGRVIRMPLIKDPRHDWILENLTAALVPYARARKLGRCTFEQLGYALTALDVAGGTLTAPDLAFVSTARLHLQREASQRKQYAQLAPDLAVEIVSPSQNTTAEMERRAQRWLEAGARLVWNIWPDAERVDVWPADGEMQALSAGASLDGGDVITGFSMPVADLFIYD